MKIRVSKRCQCSVCVFNLWWWWGDFQIRDNGKGKEKGLGGWKEVVTVVITEE